MERSLKLTRNKKATSMSLFATNGARTLRTGLLALLGTSTESRRTNGLFPLSSSTSMSSFSGFRSLRMTCLFVPFAVTASVQHIFWNSVRSASGQTEAFGRNDARPLLQLHRVALPSSTRVHRSTAGDRAMSRPLLKLGGPRA